VSASLIFFRGSNAGRPDPFRPGPHKARTMRAGPPRPAYFMRAENTGPPRILLGPQAGPLFFFMIKLSMFKNWEILRSSQN